MQFIDLAAQRARIGDRLKAAILKGYDDRYGEGLKSFDKIVR